MTADLQMARGNIEDGFNLAVGEPEFLQSCLYFGPLMDYNTSWKYPTIDGHKALRDELETQFPNRHIVITNGAKQALSAAFYAYKIFFGRTYVRHSAPYWPSYPTLTKMADLNFCTVPHKHSDIADIHCITSPNNPDGSQSMEKCDIWDGAYAGPVYGLDRVPTHETAIYSAAKMLGLSGLRVGWLATDIKEIAQYAANYVEFTTSGVATPCQAYVANALKTMRTNFSESDVEAAQIQLSENGKLFREYLGDYVIEYSGVPLGDAGMFAWFSVKDLPAFTEACYKAKIRLVSGPACGGEQNQFRMSMGLLPIKTEEALKTLKKYL